MNDLELLCLFDTPARDALSESARQGVPYKALERTAERLVIKANIAEAEALRVYHYERAAAWYRSVDL